VGGQATSRIGSAAPDCVSPVRMKKLQPDEMWLGCEARGWMERIIRELQMIAVGEKRSRGNLHDR
jgi:hypothetical protein